MNSPIIKNLLILTLCIIVIGYFAYVLFVKTPTPAVSETVPVEDVSISGQEILNLTNKLKSISIDQAIFSSPMFLTLKDFGTVLVPELQGRPNPFAAIGTDIGYFTTQQTNSTSTGVKKIQ